MMETRGMPTVTFCTVPFRTLAQLRREALGLPDMPVVLLPHPMMTKTRPEIDQLAGQFLDEVVAGLTRQPAGTEAAP